MGLCAANSTPRPLLLNFKRRGCHVIRRDGLPATLFGRGDELKGGVWSDPPLGLAGRQSRFIRHSELVSGSVLHAHLSVLTSPNPSSRHTNGGQVKKEGFGHSGGFIRLCSISVAIYGDAEG
jgi:hypothetical protein